MSKQVAKTKRKTAEHLKTSEHSQLKLSPLFTCSCLNFIFHIDNNHTFARKLFLVHSVEIYIFYMFFCPVPGTEQYLENSKYSVYIY